VACAPTFAAHTTLRIGAARCGIFGRGFQPELSADSNKHTSCDAAWDARAFYFVKICRQRGSYDRNNANIFGEPVANPFPSSAHHDDLQEIDGNEARLQFYWYTPESHEAIEIDI